MSLEIFISCSDSQQDKALRDKLIGFLQRTLENQGIEIWHEDLILPGANTQDTIELHLNSAKIILLLVSIDLLTSKSNIIGQAMRLGQARVIPVILRPCPWQVNGLQNLQCLPRGKQTLNDFNDDNTKERALFEIAQEIESVTKNIRSSLGLRQVYRSLPGRIQLTGRETEIQNLFDYITNSHYPILLEGFSGVGKTVVAIEAAYRCLEASVSGRILFDAIIFIPNDRVPSRPSTTTTLSRIFHLIADSVNQVITGVLLEEKREEIYDILRRITPLLLVDNKETIYRLVGSSPREFINVSSEFLLL